MDDFEEREEESEDEGPKSRCELFTLSSARR